MLETPASLKYMTEEAPHGWFNPLSSKYIDWDSYYIDREKPHWGFKSWNDFFTKPIRPEKRPLDPRKDSIVHSSDAHPLRFPENIEAKNPSENVRGES